uniref:WW domain-containing protein n=1 Tax=Mesocestoides corti TaxID=53468 RepID=A0A5K3F2Q0_MESCO
MHWLCNSGVPVKFPPKYSGIFFAENCFYQWAEIKFPQLLFYWPFKCLTYLARNF